MIHKRWVVYMWGHLIVEARGLDSLLTSWPLASQFLHIANLVAVND